MKFFEMTSRDVYTNLATEEYMFRNYCDDTYFLLWNNDASIVVGKNQNVFQEINLPLAEREGIYIARRITGGGAVFHDTGNLNYSILMDHNPDTFSYDQCLEPVIHALVAMGVPVHKRRTSDIAINGMKVSGSAQTISRGRVLHHGTLLYQADLIHLNNLLTPLSGEIYSKATPSVPSTVTNIIDHIDQKLSFDEFKRQFIKQIIGSGTKRVALTSHDWQAIYELRATKYLDWEWNFGRSPEFIYEKRADDVYAKFHIKKARVVDVKIAGIANADKIALALERIPFGYQSLKDALQKSQINESDIEILLMHLFRRRDSNEKDH